MAYAPRPRIGLSNVVYAVLTESSDVSGGTPTYGTIKPLANALELSFDPAGNSATLFADDGAAFVADNVGEMKISFGVADIDPASLAEILGQTYANGIITQNSTDQSPYIAIGAKRLRAGKDGANAVYDYFWLPKVKLTKPKEDAKTKGASIEFQTPMLEGSVVKLVANGNYRAMARSDDANLATGTISGWFNSVVTSSSADLTALTVVAAAGAGASGTFLLTFSKASNSGSIPFSITDAAIAQFASAFRVAKVSDGSKVTTTYARLSAGTGFSNSTVTVTGSTGLSNTAVFIGVPGGSVAVDASGVAVSEYYSGSVTTRT